MVIINLDQLDDLIKIAVELGEGKTDLTPEQLQMLREYVADFTPQQHADFMQCKYVMVCCLPDVGLLSATDAQTNIMVMTLTGRVAA